MIDIIEAYDIAKKTDKELKTLYYSEFQDKYFFCQGDTEAYITVDKNTGHVEMFNRTEAIMDPVFNGNVKPGTKEYENHMKYCDDLNEALNNDKKIPIVKAKKVS